MSNSQTILLEKAGDSSGSEAWRGLAASVPVVLGVAPMALVLGAQAAQKGLTLAEVPLMTGLNFAGGSEFAGSNSGPPLRTSC